ncbi:DUF3810 domain-containing protein [Moheibacter stercoris]|uniref:DUF3810 domain-containing protein n=1 Tax=Moheibacter stercoris TaxID=1628251 RepID=A0ABV2LU50_9FLAO
MVLIFAILLVRILGFTRFPDLVFPKIHSFFANIFYSITSLFSISIGDLIYSMLIILGILFLGRIIYYVLKRNYSELKNSIVKILYFLAGFYLYFHLIWGFNYYKTPLKENYNVEVDSVEELKGMAHQYFVKAAYYRKIVSEDENGNFKMSLSIQSLREELNQSALKIQSQYPELFMRNPNPANLKSSLYSEGFSYLGVLGYFNPFTNEAQYNVKMPDSKLLFTKCHETAHQWGYASESEANFIGFVLANESNHPDLQYAANFKAMRSLLNRILWVDPLYVKYYVEVLYTDGMKRDRQNELDINAQYGGSAEDAFSLMNEAFLRLNNQEGLESYGKFVELLVGFNRKYSSN